MKKAVTFILVIAVVLCLAACGADTGVQNPAVNDISQLEQAQAAIDAGKYEEAYKILCEDRFRTEEEEELFSKLVYVPLTVNDGEKNVATYTYDEKGNLLKKDEPDGMTTYTYDENGQVLSEERADTDGRVWCKYVYTYDKDGNCLTKYEEVVDTSWNKYTYTYDKDGNILTYRYEDNNGEWNTETNTYDEDGNELTSRYEDSAGTSYQTTYTNIYDSQGNRIERIEESTNGEKTTRYYDEQGRYTGYCTENSDGSWRKRTYGIDKTGRFLSESVASSDGTSRVVLRYTYDANGKILIAENDVGTERAGKRTFTYNKNGDRISGTGVQVNAMSHTVTYSCTYDDHSNILNCNKHFEGDNILYSDETYTYTYDTNGKVLTAMCYFPATENSKEYSYGYSFTYRFFYYPNGVPGPVSGVFSTTAFHFLFEPLAIMMQTIQ